MFKIPMQNDHQDYYLTQAPSHVLCCAGRLSRGVERGVSFSSTVFKRKPTACGTLIKINL